MAMSTILSPSVPPSTTLQALLETTAQNELKWLLDASQETFRSLRSGLSECLSLIHNVDDPTTLVVSSRGGEAVKGILVRRGGNVDRFDITLRLLSLPPQHTPTLQLKLASSSSLTLPPLTQITHLLRQSLDIVDAATYTGDAQDPSFIAGQLQLLQDILSEMSSILRGTDPRLERWTSNMLDANSFSPKLPGSVILTLALRDASIVLSVRTLAAGQAPTPPPGWTPTSSGAKSTGAGTGTGTLSRRFAGLNLNPFANTDPVHDETYSTFFVRGETVRVREKVSVDSADPGLMAVMAKIGALKRTVDVAVLNLKIVRGQSVDDDD